MKGISSLGHIGIKVKDLDKSIAFYTQTMGFPEMFRLHRDDGRVWLVYLRITDDQYLEIFPEAVQDRAPEPESNGINHFCLTVENIEEVVRQLSGKGITLYLPLKTGADNNRQAWVQDPDGNRIELMEMAPNALQFKAIKELHASGRAGATISG
jgi:lactoylglutathione lyase